MKAVTQKTFQKLHVTNNHKNPYPSSLATQTKKNSQLCQDEQVHHNHY